MARPREFDEAQVLRAAQGAFRAGGYAGTSLADLTSAPGLGKGSLYGAFGDKHGLFVRVLDDYCAGGTAGVAAVLEGEGRGLDRLRAYLLDQARDTTDGSPSCLMASSGAELAARDAQVHDRLAETYAALRGSFARAVRDAQHDGDVDAGADADVLAGLLLAVARGMEALGHAGSDEAELRRTAEAAIAGLPRPVADRRTTA